MAKALIIYGSTTGNTESTANIIAKAVLERDIDATVKDVSSAGQDDFGNAYDIFLLGSSTWGDEEIALQDDFAEFYEETMDQLDFGGKKVAVFGCGDSDYTHFCGAVDALEEKTKALGGKLVVDGLKIDGDPYDYDDEIIAWANSVADAI